MLNVGALREGFVLDHIKAGKAMTIYHDLKLDKLDCTVAIIKNAKSNKMGKKDIIKVECPIEDLDLDILGFIDHNITVNIIKDEKIVEKKDLRLPKQVVLELNTLKKWRNYMKAHKYWSVGALITMLGTFYTGYKKQKSSHKYFALSSMLCMVMAIYTGHKMITGNRKKKANKEKDTEREG